MTLKELLLEWLNENHIYHIKDRTLLRYRCCIDNHIINDVIATKDIEEIVPRDINHYVYTLVNKVSYRTGKPLSHSTINTIIAIIKLAYGYANDYEITQCNPTLRIKRLSKETTTKLKVFTREEQIRIEHYIEQLSTNDYFGIILTFYTGLRLGELLALTWKDINLKTGIISINKTLYKHPDNGFWKEKIGTPKSKTSIREIPLPMFLREKLKALKKERKSTMIVAYDNGKKIDDKIFVYRYHRLLKKAKVRDLNFHCLRHTFATRALENKMDIKTLSEILGHASVATTLNIYTHSLIEHKRSQMRKMKRLI